ncbi:hypothetical protein [Holospora curviuscula]|uniref:Uncharacterized protein n=1 Tax=Holospora curviuscula TaxID=1082868 RepID=A0A2S5RA88_9PROT|nr:hypothetical protein [Holospora curviuscula]PPE04239.1 hypothetical protein HCUR_00430 [Holospora curviuscula]
MSYSLNFRSKGLGIKQKEGVSYEKSGRQFVRSKPARTMDMDCLEHDITIDPDAYQPNASRALLGLALLALCKP